MPREHPDYRNNLELLNDLFPGKLMLTVEDVMVVTGYKSANSVRHNYPIVRGMISKAQFARLMCN
jgi:hypothetical protein